MKLFELRMARDLAAKAASALVQKAIDESRALTPEEDAGVKARQAEMTELSRKIEMVELRDSFAPASAGSDGGRLGPELPDLRSYSLLRAMRMQLAVREGVPGAKFDGLEAEAHQELAKSKPAGSEVRGILVPWTLGAPAERRDVTTTTATGGIANVLGTSLIDLLRNRMVMQAMGANVLTGLTGGTFALPKQTAGETAYHVAEASAPTASNLTLGQVVWTPRTIAAQSAITRKTILQNSLDVEALVRNSLMQQIAREFDRVGVNGSGTGNIPLGIMQDPNVPTEVIGTNGGAMTWAALVNLEKRVAVANADFGSMGYLTSNAGRAALKKTPKIGSTFPVFMWENAGTGGVGEVNGYRAMASEQVPTTLTKGTLSGTGTAVVFGNFGSATYGLWSGVDMLVDPYSAGNTGNIKLYAFQDYDFQMVYEVGFAKVVDLDPAA